MRIYSLGALKSPYDKRDYKLNKLVKSTVDISDKEYINNTPYVIFNQSTTSTCVGCSLAQGKHFIEYNQINDNKQFSPTYIYGNRSMNDYKGEGMIPREALKTLQKYGICHYEDLGGLYTFIKSRNLYENNKHELDTKAYPYRISSYYRLETDDDIKRAIKTIGFAWVSYDVYDCMFNPKCGVVQYDENNLGQCEGGHQVLIIGFNEIGWVVLNSWGEEYSTIHSDKYGDKKGCAIIPYSYKPTEAWAIVDEITEKEISLKYGNRFMRIINKIKNVFKK